MAGVILELLNIRKLCGFGVLILVGQITSFLLGGLIAPAPNTSEQILTLKCIDRDSVSNMNKWFFPRPITSNYSCKDILEDTEHHSELNARQIVFMSQMPLPKEGIHLDMTKWFQQIISVLMVEIKYKPEIEIPKEALMTFDVRLGYRNRGDADHDWKELARSRETRPLQCEIDEDEKTDGNYYKCEVLPLFSLGSCHYDYYLLNIRVPIDPQRGVNTDIGMLTDLWTVEIHQNGGFTQVWLSMKTVIFPINLAALIFFKRRVSQLPRHANLLERTIFALGVVIGILNVPIEWLSLRIDFPGWLIISDIRQGLFLATLFCFWIVFTGEHMMDDQERNRIVAYWKQLLVVGLGSAILFLFEIAERGVQLQNPFYSIWSQPVPARIGLAFVIMSAVCALLYFLFLLGMIARVLHQMVGKRRLLPELPENRRRYYSGVIYRFMVLILYTLFCAALTVAFFIVSQVDEDSWKWGGERIHYNSAFITGVYGMWNLYVFTLLCLYSPSHKFRGIGRLGHADPGESTVDSCAGLELRATSVSGMSGDGAPASTSGATGEGVGGSQSASVSTVKPKGSSASMEGIAFLQKAAQE